MTKEEYLNSDFVTMLHLNNQVVFLSQKNKKLEKEIEQLKQQLENEKQLNAEIKKRLVEVEYDCEEFNHEYCDSNCNGKRKETIDLLQLVSDGLNETLLKQKDTEIEQLKNTIMQLRKQADKMKNCSNCNGIIKGGLRTERCKICIKDTTFGYWEFAE